MRFEGGLSGEGTDPGGAASDSRLLSSRDSRPGSSPRTAVSHRAHSHTVTGAYLGGPEPCLYSHATYRHAARVFDVLRHPPRDPPHTPGPRRGRPAPRGHQRGDTSTPPGTPPQIPAINFDDDNQKRLTFQLVFQTLKYQRFLEDMLDDCMFFGHYPEFKEDTALVMVMLCDFKQRKFQRAQRASASPETAGGGAAAYLSHIEDTLWLCRTKLNAALARSRIKARVLSIDHLLPASVRQNEKIGSNMHVYGWVNACKTSVSAVLSALKAEGYCEVEGEDRLVGRTFLVDHQCDDLLGFPYDLRDQVEGHDLVQAGHLVLQDKSSCVGPHSVRALINEGDDILHINPGAGLTTAHIASLTHGSDTVVYVAGLHGETQTQQVTARLDRLGARARVKILGESFLSIEHHDERLRHIKVALLSAECSRSGVANPVNFIVSEAEDMSILRDLSLGHTDENKLGELVMRHNATLKHALRFPRVQAVVYCTRSLHEAENENVVTRALEYVNTVQHKSTVYRIAPPVIPLSDHDIETENPLNGKYLRYPPSPNTSGCFVATITREADDPKDAAKDILAKAAARGILSGVAVTGRDDKPHKAKSKSGRKRDKTAKGGRKKSPARSQSKPGRSAVSTKLYTDCPVTFTYSHRALPHAHPSSPAVMVRSPGPPHTRVIQHPKPFR